MFKYQYRCYLGVQCAACLEVLRVPCEVTCYLMRPGEAEILPEARHAAAVWAGAHRGPAILVADPWADRPPIPLS